MVAFLQERVNWIQKSYRFDRQNGYAQVQGRGEVINRVYAEWDTLNRIIEAIEGKEV